MTLQKINKTFIKNTLWCIHSLILYINNYYYNLHNFLLFKSNKTIWMFYWKFADKGDNPMNNPNIFNVEGNNRLLPGRQPLTTGKSAFLVIVFALLILFCCLLLNKVFKFLNILIESILYNKTVIAFLWGERFKLSSL